MNSNGMELIALVNAKTQFKCVKVVELILKYIVGISVVQEIAL